LLPDGGLFAMLAPSVSEAQRQLERSRELSIRRRVPEVPVWRTERPRKILVPADVRLIDGVARAQGLDFLRANGTKNNAVRCQARRKSSANEIGAAYDPNR
jgi:hypothetical protein